jgi:hypothetical protein
MRKTIKRRARKNRTRKGGGPFNKLKKMFSRKKPQPPVDNSKGKKNVLNEEPTKRPDLNIPANGNQPPRKITTKNAQRNLIVYGLTNPAEALERQAFLNEWGKKIKNRKNVGFRPTTEQPPTIVRPEWA